MNDNYNGALVAQNNTAVAVTTFDEKAGLWGKKNWNQFPAQMLSSRVLAKIGINKKTEVHNER